MGNHPTRRKNDNNNNKNNKKEIPNLRTFARKFSSRYNIFKFLLQAGNELLVPEMQKKLGVTVFVLEIKRVVNYTDVEKLSHRIA